LSLLCDIINKKKNEEIKIKSGVKIVNMNKNMIKKVILVLLLIALFSIVLGGCTIIGVVTIPLRGTVYITVDESDRKLIEPIPNYYNIFMDDYYMGTIESDGTLVLQKVSLGNHTFEAWDVSPDVYCYCYGFVSQVIVSGVNDVTIIVYTY